MEEEMILYIHHAGNYGAFHRILLNGSFVLTRRDRYKAIRLYDHGVPVTHGNLPNDSWVDIFVFDMETGEVIHHGESGESYKDAIDMVSDPMIRAVKVANAQKAAKLSERQEP